MYGIENRNIAMAAVVAFGLASVGHAGVVSGTATTGFSIIAAPAEVGNNNQQDPMVFAWNEQQNVVLPVDLVADVGGTILAGTRVASHGIVFDPVNATNTTASVTFDRPILGVLYLTDKLAATDALLGAPGTIYNSPSARGLENGAERASTLFSGNTLEFTWRASSPGDNVRVLTAAVPEPATWAMLIAGFGMVGFAARRRRVAHANA